MLTHCMFIVFLDIKLNFSVSGSFSHHLPQLPGYQSEFRCGRCHACLPHPFSLQLQKNLAVQMCSASKAWIFIFYVLAQIKRKSILSQSGWLYMGTQNWVQQVQVRQIWTDWFITVSSSLPGKR